ncbi:MAG: endonuclease YncB(thermonuclease family) [Alphaproteobacteria bacterium]|jgi:endonuclease YncB( thermonuclease family)
MKLILFIIVALLTGFPNTVLAEPASRATVIDGDTIEIGGQRIRLFGIDAPEGRQICQQDGKPWRCGQQSAFSLADLLGRHWIKCIQRDRDQYQRIVAVCYINKLDVNGEMVRQGWALDYRRYSKGRYSREEAEAKSATRGIWVGEFEKPWDWRQGKRAAGAPSQNESVSPKSPPRWFVP